MGSKTDPFIKYTCTYCEEGNNEVIIKCAECSDFYLCLQCFSHAAELGPHRANHSYSVLGIDSSSTITKSGWTFKEMLFLLEGVENSGYRNWDDVSKHVVTKTPQECEEEFKRVYINDPVGKAVWKYFEDRRPKLRDYTAKNEGPFASSNMSKAFPLDITSTEAALLGYTPQRDDFEKEYNDAVELLVSQLSFNPNEDTALDVALKLARIDIYQNTLRDRVARKRLVKDFQLANTFFVARKERQPPKPEMTKQRKELEEQYRPFCRYFTALEFRSFLDNLERERMLLKRFKKLSLYRKYGIKKIDQIPDFEKHYQMERKSTLKKKKEKLKERQRKLRKQTNGNNNKKVTIKHIEKHKEQQKGGKGKAKYKGQQFYISSAGTESDMRSDPSRLSTNVVLIKRWHPPPVDNDEEDTSELDHFPSSKSSAVKRKKKRRKKKSTLFGHKKTHLLHRTPENIAAYNKCMMKTES